MNKNTIYCILISICACLHSLAQTMPDPLSNAKNSRFIGWTDEDYQVYEDSIFAILYPPVIAQKLDTIISGNQGGSDGVTSKTPLLTDNAYVPNSVILDKTKAVGQIVIQSGTTSTGAKTYNIPIDVYPGMKGFNPELALFYNSQQGNSVVGVGWSLSGIPMVTRAGKSVYYDGKSQGIQLNKEDIFLLNGVHLIKKSETASNVIYESEQGNIKVKSYISGNVTKYFEVFYPDGNKGVFGLTTNTVNNLFYPIISLSDLKGNKIDYSYTYVDNHYRISKIVYNGASVEFQYQTSRPDPVLYYSGGLKVNETNLLQNIVCKFGSSVLGTYALSYTTQNNLSLLTKIDYVSNGSSYNPLLFYYGEGFTANNYTKSETQLLEWYKANDPAMIKVTKGKFDYDSGADGLISLPNKNPYWKHYRHSTSFRHSQNRFDNNYTGDEKIFLYAGLTDNMASPMPNLLTEKGFVDIICADIEGQQEEYVIKINNQVVNDKDQVTFHVYRSNLFSGLSKKYTRTFSFPTVYTDADDGKSIQPKYYYSGDFNGDGKMEILAVSCHQPFGDTSKPSKCYLFDLAGNRILYQNNVFPYVVDFVGTEQTDPKVVANNSDKLFVMDYDGDGKSDICHIGVNGVSIYTFDVTGITWSSRKIGTYTGLKKADLANRALLLSEINGDGLMDLLVSPSNETGAVNLNTWTSYNSTGNGQFDKSTFNGTYNPSSGKEGFIMQDINGDGMTDLVKYSSSGFFTYLAKNNNVGISSCYESFPSTGSILIPTNINTHSYFTQLLSLKEGKVTKYSFSRNDSKEVLATGMVNSLGVIEKNKYQLINEEGISSGVYSKGTGAVFPYVNIHEPIAVLASFETYMNKEKIDNSRFLYHNAVIHRQGLGFRGFETITCYNKKGQSLVQTYEPYRYSVLKSEISPEFKKTYNYAVDVQTDKIVKIRLNSKVEEDLLKKTSASTSFIYDTYGYPTQEITAYTGNISIKKTNVYSSKVEVGDGYYLGFLIDQTVAVTRGASTYTERMSISSHVSGLPLTRIYYVDGNQSKYQTFIYDAKGNVTTESSKLYSSTNSLTTSYLYDTYGRLSEVTNPLGLKNKYVYNSTGRVESIKDHRGGSTSYIYDVFGREKSVTMPDNTTLTTDYQWSEEGVNGLYSIKKSSTGKPVSRTVYDALNRNVRNSETRFDGTVINTDRLYDSYGNLQKVSLPFPGSSPSIWNTYTYDNFDRITSYVEASGRKTTYSYNGNSVTTVEDKISATRNYDVQNNLISVTDPAGTITYNLYADGLPISIVAPGNVTTSFGYDKYRRRTSMDDPSQGRTIYKYDTSGNVYEETHADGQIIKSGYDSYNRLKSVTTPEFVTTYTYNEKDELTGISTNNGTAKTFAYDVAGRLTTWKESAVDNKWLQKIYTYADGNISSIKYTSQSGVLATENYIYAYGHLSEMKLNGQTTVYKLSKENSYGQPTEVVTGEITRKYDFTAYGLPSGRSSSGFSKTYQNFAYTFDPTTCNLLNRKDVPRGKTEFFEYDGLNRLTNYTNELVSYDVKGNLLSKSDVGTFEYTNEDKPYAVSKAVAENGIPARNQEVTYNSFWRPNSISENNYAATFIYNGEYDRVKMSLTKNGSRTLTRYYMGSCYELEQGSSSTTERLYLFGDYYNAAAVYIKDNSGGNLYYILRDYLGSIMQVVSSDGTLKQELSYDAWGRLRDPVTGVVYASDEEPDLFLGRGYTGHEHLPWFGIVNMNARLYDPVVGRFLSPDPYVQAPDFSQNFNRYAYAMNNPLRYVDENGEFIHIIIGAIIGGTVNLIYKAVSGQLHSFKDGFVAFGIGAAAGGLGAATGGLAFAAAGGAAGGIGGFVAGAAGGAAGTAAMMPVQSAGNSLYFGDPFMSLKDYAIGIAGGALTGGIANGSIAALKGNNFWTGKEVQFGRGTFSFNNTATRPAPEMKLLEAPTPSLNVEQPAVGAANDKLSNLASTIKDQTEQTRSLPYAVTDKGVVLPNDVKYQIPSDYIVNPKANIPNSTSYGIMKNGEFIEKLRIDAGTPPGMKGPSQSHYHLNMKGRHYMPGGKSDPGFGAKIKF